MTRTLGLAVILLLLLNAGCDRKSSDDHLASAKAFLGESRPDAAVIELKSALQKSGDLAEARWLLGKTYLEKGDIDPAVKELRLAREFGWPADDVAPLLARGLLAQREYVKVRKLKLDGLGTAARAQVMSTQALSEFAQGELALANTLIEEALALQPDATDIQLAEARILFGLNDQTGAEAVVVEILDKAPGYGPAWSLLGDLRIRQSQPAQALEAYSKAIESGNRLADRLKRGLILVQMQEYDQAAADADALLSRSPANPGGNYIRGQVLYQKQQYADAILPLSLAESAWRKFPLVLYFLGSSHLLVGNLNQADVFSSRFLDSVPGSVAGIKLLATVRLKRGMYSSVEALVAPLLEEAPGDVAAMNLLATALIKSGQLNEGIVVLERLVESDPDSASALVRLGAGLLAAGNTGDAERRIASALALDPNLQQADVLMVLSHLQRKDYAAAISAATAYRQRHPEAILPAILLGRVHEASGDLPNARASLEAALRLSPGNPSANHSLAQIAMEQGDLVEARRRYEAVLVGDSSHLASNIQLALLDAREGRTEAVEKRLENTIGAHPQALEPKLILARYYLSEGKVERVASLFATLEPSQRRTPRVLELIALSQISGSEYKRAAGTLEDILAATPDTPEARHLLAMASAGTGNSENSRAELEAALALDPEFLPSRVALARMDLREKSLEEFLRHLDILVELSPDSPDVMQLRAAAADLEGKREEAALYAGKAFESAPATHTMLELAHYRRLAGEEASAMALMRDWVEEHTGDLAARLALADALREGGSVQGAVTQYEAIVERAPDNIAALSNLAWLLRETDTARARELSDRAIALAPDSPQVLYAAAMVHFYGKDYRLARRNIRRAIVKEPDNVSYRYHSAVIEAAAGDRENAIAILERLTTSQDDFPERPAALALLSQLSM